MMGICKKCGWILPENARFCPGCGVALAQPKQHSADVLRSLKRGTRPSCANMSFDMKKLSQLGDEFFATLAQPLRHFDGSAQQARTEAMLRIARLATELVWMDEKPFSFDRNCVVLPCVHIDYHYGCIENDCYDGGNMSSYIAPKICSISRMSCEEYEKKVAELRADEYYDRLVADGKEVWAYTSTYPDEDRTEICVYGRSLLLREPLGLNCCLQLSLYIL